MTDKLQVDQQGRLSFRGVSLCVRYIDDVLTFPIKHHGDRKRLESKRVRVPLEEFQKLRRRAAEGATVATETHPVTRGRYKTVDKVE
jgi:hypothetical protein